MAEAEKEKVLKFIEAAGLGRLIKKLIKNWNSGRVLARNTLEEMDEKEIELKTAAILENSFSSEEISELAKFFESAVGKKWLTSRRKIYAQVVAVVEERIYATIERQTNIPSYN